MSGGLIGRLSGVVPDALRFCFDLGAQGTTLEGATLEIIDRPGLAHCVSCESEFELNDLLGLCASAGSSRSTS